MKSGYIPKKEGGIKAAKVSESYNYLITGYLGEGVDVVIPKTIYGATVTKIKDDNLDFFRS